MCCSSFCIWSCSSKMCCPFFCISSFSKIMLLLLFLFYTWSCSKIALLLLLYIECQQDYVAVALSFLILGVAARLCCSFSCISSFSKIMLLLLFLFLYLELQQDCVALGRSGRVLVLFCFDIWVAVCCCLLLVINSCVLIDVLIVIDPC